MCAESLSTYNADRRTEGNPTIPYGFIGRGLINTHIPSPATCSTHI